MVKFRVRIRVRAWSCVTQLALLSPCPCMFCIWASNNYIFLEAKWRFAMMMTMMMMVMKVSILLTVCAWWRPTRSLCLLLC